MPKRLVIGMATILLLALMVSALHTRLSTSAAKASSSPITHVVVIFQENHAFDDILGGVCLQDRRDCNASSTGVLPDGTVIPLRKSPDFTPNIGHSGAAQTIAMNGGAMNGSQNLAGCDEANRYACYQQADPASIPNLTALARRFAISDATFETSSSASWASHMALVSNSPNGFVGSPVQGQSTQHGKGDGCDSYKDAPWALNPSDTPVLVPACIPKQDGTGPYRQSPVAWTPTIMDRLDAAGRTWKLFAALGPNVQGGATGYVWTICPTFAECIYGPQAANFVPSADVLTAAQDGTLPDVSLVIPQPLNSQHNHRSLAQGDNWIGSVVSAVENGPDWDSTAIFIAYDDCGCFYDHVRPPTGSGLRAPMVIVSPYAKAGYTDHTTTTFNGILAYIEHTFGLSPLGASDQDAYDFSDAFDYSQQPIPPVTMTKSRVPAWETRLMREHPQPDGIT